MIYKFFVMVFNRRQRQFEHNLFLLTEFFETREDLFLENNFNLSLFGAGNVNLRLEDRDHPGGNNLLSDLKLLVDQRLYTICICRLDNASHLGAEYSIIVGLFQKFIECWHGFHDLYAVLFRSETLIDLEKRNHLLLFPQILRSRFALNFTVHRVFEQDRTQDAVTGKCRRCYHASSHGMDDIVHGRFSLDVIVIRNTVLAQCFRGGSS
mmetsp:Transcript_15422/g.17758  ORF Transcript_15422/g.17758 Transcript_15422/m.17758 type:complete len:209 (+) Transcript_15422:484-1110(+)